MPITEDAANNYRYAAGVRRLGFPGQDDDARALLADVNAGRLRPLARLELNEILLLVIEFEDGTGACVWTDGPRADVGFYDTAVEALRSFAVARVETMDADEVIR